MRKKLGNLETTAKKVRDIQRGVEAKTEELHTLYASIERILKSDGKLSEAREVKKNLELIGQSIRILKKIKPLYIEKEGEELNYKLSRKHIRTSPIIDSMIRSAKLREEKEEKDRKEKEKKEAEKPWYMRRKKSE